MRGIHTGRGVDVLEDKSFGRVEGVATCSSPATEGAKIALSYERMDTVLSVDNVRSTVTPFPKTLSSSKGPLAVRLLGTSDRATTLGVPDRRALLGARLLGVAVRPPTLLGMLSERERKPLKADKVLGVIVVVDGGASTSG